MKRRIDEIHHVQGQSYDEALEKEHEASTKVKNIKVIEIGRYEVDTWYFSPYPDAFAMQSRLYICPYSLKYFKRRDSYVRHLAAVTRRGPPGLRIYAAPAPPQPEANAKLGLPQPARLTLYEVDGSTAKVYCQCLCLLAKLFLDHKTLYYARRMPRAPSRSRATSRRRRARRKGITSPAFWSCLSISGKAMANF
jgi:histone acetyltransferase MYST1